MRVTQSMLSRNTLFNLSQQRADLNTIQNQIASGKAVAKPSDDPTRYSRILRLQNKQNQNGQYIDNVNVSQNAINNSVRLLEAMSDIALQASDIAIKAADGQTDPAMRTTLAGEIHSMIASSISLSNSKYMSKNVFAGTDTQTATPFVYQNDVVSYTGNDKKVYRSYSESVKVSINVPGKDIMDTGFFSGLTALETALRADDQAGIDTAIDNMKSAQDKMLAVTSELGARSTNLNLIRSRLEQENIDMSGYLSKNQDTKMDEAIVRYQGTKLAYETSLKVTASSLQLNIMQYL